MKNNLFSITSLCIFNTLALTHLILRVLLVDNEQTTFTTNDLAVGCALL